MGEMNITSAKYEREAIAREGDMSVEEIDGKRS